MKSESMEQHRKEADLEIKCAVITLSDSKFELFESKGINEDISGQKLTEKLNEKYVVNYYKIIPDESDTLINEIKIAIASEVDVIFLTGGTGISSRDITIETVKKLFKKELPGFGEIFRYKTFEELSSGALLTRATAGIYDNTLIFAMPGSPNAVELGLNLVFNELPHLVKHMLE